MQEEETLEITKPKVSSDPIAPNAPTPTLVESEKSAVPEPVTVESEQEQQTETTEITEDELQPTPAEAFDVAVPEATRDISMVENFTKSIREATSFDELHNTIKTIDYVEGTLGFYTKSQLIGLLGMVEHGEQDPVVITRNAGLRAKVYELLGYGDEEDGVVEDTASTIGFDEGAKDSKEQIMQEFLALQRMNLVAFKNLTRATQHETLLDKIKGKFGSETALSLKQRSFENIQERYNEVFQKAIPIIKQKRLEQKNNELIGSVLFSDLNKEAQLQLQQLYYARNEDMKNPTSSISEEDIQTLIEANAVTEAELRSYKEKASRPEIEKQIVKEIQHELFITERDAMSEIALSALDGNAKSITKRILQLFHEKPVSPQTVAQQYK
jgi:hypothetical protein